MTQFVASLLLSSSPLAALLPADDTALAEYRTTATAIKVAQELSGPARSTGLSSWVGIGVESTKSGLTIKEIVPGSPAATIGAKPGDIIKSVNKVEPKTVTDFRDLLMANPPGSVLAINVARKGKTQTLTITTTANSRPMSISDELPVAGLTLGDTADEGLQVRRVQPGSPAAKAGLRPGDIVTKLDGKVVSEASALDLLLQEKKAGDSLVVTVLTNGASTDTTITLAEAPPRDSNTTFSPRAVFKKDVYRLGIIGLEYDDVKHNSVISNQAWTDSLFSTGIYNTKSVTGQTVYGSMNDYYQELSAGKFRVEGKVFDWVQMSKKRMDYSEGNGTGNRSRQMLFGEALDKLIARDGEDALKDLDGVFFVHAGGRVQTSRGSIYWPHRSSYRYKNRNIPYFIVPEGGSVMTNISVMCHEFGHMIGLPDLYARPENPGSEGLGIWCAMSNQAGNGRPQHFSAWCKIQLGWLKPTVIDPRVPQKLILGPVNGSSTECYKVLARPDGSEYFLLENRRRTGFDTSLPAQGLLIWHVVGNRPQLVESHGVDGPPGPGVYTGFVPFPSAANHSFTPFTTPSSRSILGGGFSVNITNITQLPDGRVSFWIGYEIV